MKRYQVYLNPHSVNILDEVEKLTGLSRSQFIRDAIDALSHNLAQLLSRSTHLPQKSFTLDSLVGLINPKDQKTTHFALKKDRDYLGD